MPLKRVVKEVLCIWKLLVFDQSTIFDVTRRGKLVEIIKTTIFVENWIGNFPKKGKLSDKNENCHRDIEKILNRLLFLGHSLVFLWKDFKSSHWKQFPTIKSLLCLNFLFYFSLSDKKIPIFANNHWIDQLFIQWPPKSSDHLEKKYLYFSYLGDKSNWKSATLTIL